MSEEFNDSGDGDGEVGEIEDTPNPMSDVAQQMARRYKVKIDGQEQEVGEDELLQNYQLKKSSDQRFQQGMQARKQAEEFIHLLKTDPSKVLSHPSIGVDVKEWAMDFLTKEYQKELMSPEEKQLSEYREKLARYEEQEKLTKQQEQEQQKIAVRQKHADNYNAQIISALETSGLPKTEYTAGRIIHYLSKALDNGYDVEAKDVTDLVRRDYINDTKALYSGLNAEALISILGDDVAKKIRKSDLDKIKSPYSNPSKVPTNSGKAAPKQEKTNKKMSSQEFRDYLENIK